MKRQDFYKILINELEMDDKEITDSSPLHLTSLNALALISLVDENFGVRLKANDIKEIDNVDKLLNLIGKEKFDYTKE